MSPKHPSPAESRDQPPAPSATFVKEFFNSKSKKCGSTDVVAPILSCFSLTQNNGSSWAACNISQVLLVPLHSSSQSQRRSPNLREDLETRSYSQKLSNNMPSSTPQEFNPSFREISFGSQILIPCPAKQFYFGHQILISRKATH